MTVVKPKLSMQFAPDQWNDPIHIRASNCLSYALDEPALGWAFDGFESTISPHNNNLRQKFDERSRSKPKGINYYSIIFKLAGFERIRQHQYTPDQRHIIAFIPSFGHYFRLDGDGIWSHKNGATRARNCDDKGRIITCLESARFQELEAHETLNELRARNLRKTREEFQINVTNNVLNVPNITDRDVSQLIARIRHYKKTVLPKCGEIIYLALPEDGVRIAPCQMDCI